MSEENTRLVIKLLLLFIIWVILLCAFIIKTNHGEDASAFIAASFVIIAIGVSLL